MIVNISYDDIDLTPYMTILDGFTLFGGAEFNPQIDESFKDIDGGKFLYTSKKTKTIKVPFMLKENPTLKDSYDYLMRVFNTKEPKKLTFSNANDRYYLAIPNGNIDTNEYQHLGTCEIEFIVPDGVAYSNQIKEFIATPNENGVLQANVVNNGSTPCPIDYEITMHSDNGFIGIVSEDGAIQYGSLDEVDTVIQDSEVLKNQQGANIVTTNKDFIPYTTINYLNTGTVGNITRTNVYKGCTNYAYTSGKYNGVGFKIPITSSTNFQAWFKTIFETSKANQTGLLMLTLANGSTPIASIVINCSSTSSAKRVVEFWCNGSKAKSISYKDNKYMNASKGNCSIFKEEGKFTFEFEGTKSTVEYENLANIGVDSINVYIASKTSKPVAYMGINSIKFQKNNCNKIVDVPNRYKNGDVVTIEGATTNYYVNGVQVLGDEVLGSTYFKAQRGTTPILINVSDWSTTNPTVKVMIREEYI